jgi:hypothetical protein
MLRLIQFSVCKSLFVFELLYLIQECLKFVFVVYLTTISE